MPTYPTVAWLTELSLPWLTRQSWANPNITGSTFWAAAAMSRPISKIVVHSTETVGFPGYREGRDNPHFTQNLTTGSCRQHVPLTHGARALEVRATSEANIGGVIQVELIGACTPGYPEQYGHYDLVRKFPVDEQAQGFLARLLAVLHEVTGVTLETTVEWVVYPASYGDAAVQRLTVAEFFAYAGVMGHQHVPGNSHGDPGSLGGAIHKVLAKARSLTTTTPEAPMYYYAADEYGTPYHLASAQTFLTALGYYTGPIRGGIGPVTGDAILAFQNATPGLTADKDPGPMTMAALATAAAKQRAAAARVPGLTADLAAVSTELATTRAALKTAKDQLAQENARATALATDLSITRTALVGSELRADDEKRRADTAEAENVELLDEIAALVAERDALAARAVDADELDAYRSAVATYAAGVRALEALMPAPSTPTL